ncbi:MAG: EAL domain-containing protein [Candidatus Omnitrophica bacterium]|nr:EAL domain-containing protein [Candidatus Omnitrophota bacterium]
MNIPRSRRHILIVDDNIAVASMLKMLLVSREYDVSVANSSEEMFEKISPAKTDLIIMDIILPDENGLEVLKKIRADAKTQTLPVVILSAKSAPNDITDALYSGADDYLTKPFKFEELLARIESVMRRSHSYSEADPAVQSESIIKQLRHIVDNELMIPAFQPIFLLKTSKVYGFEALARPQVTGLLSNPEILFKWGIQYGFYSDLELLSWQKAVKSASSKLKGKKLFLNCNPFWVEDARFIEVNSIFKDSGITPDEVVLEITERSAISNDDRFFEHLAIYRQNGFRFAVDDVGSGYASLESIVRTRPEVLKIDRHIVTNIHKDTIKMSIVRFIVRFCQENKILSIAEGIEKKEELEAVKQLGVDAVQGYFLSRPVPVIDMESMDTAIFARLEAA